MINSEIEQYGNYPLEVAMLDICDYLYGWLKVNQLFIHQIERLIKGLGIKPQEIQRCQSGFDKYLSATPPKSFSSARKVRLNNPCGHYFISLYSVAK